MVLGEQTGAYNIVHVPAHISCESNNICLKLLSSSDPHPETQFRLF